MASFWDEINRDDLPIDLQDIERELGMDAVKHLVETWGGMQLYVLSPVSLKSQVAKRVIQEEWNGRNEGDLAKRLGVPRRFVYDVIKSGHKKQKSKKPESPGQSTLFEDD